MPTDISESICFLSNPICFIILFFWAIDLNALANCNKLFSFFEDFYKLFLFTAAILENQLTVFGSYF